MSLPDPIVELRLQWPNSPHEPWDVSQSIFLVIKEYLQVQSSSSALAQSVAEKIDQLLPLKRPEKGDEKPSEEEGLEGMLWEFWDVFVKIAMQIPWQNPAQDKLVEVIKALTQLPISFTSIIWGEEVRIWQDLPILGPTLTETFHGSFIPPGAEDLSEQYQLNFHSFAARLSEVNISNPMFFMLSSLHCALEYEPYPSPRSREYQDYGQALDSHFPLALVWIAIHGGGILKKCEANTPYMYENGVLDWKGPSGFNMERWNFWKARFKKIQEYSIVSKETRAMAGKGYELMRKFEDGDRVDSVHS